MKTDTLDKDQKFFFNHNIFDDDSHAESVTTKDVEDARRQGAAEGKQQAAREHETSLQKRVEQTLQGIQGSLAQLIAAEQARQDMYETETLALVLAALQKMFPAIDRHLGLAELENFLTETLKKRDKKSRINITVSPDVVAEIKTHIDAFNLSLPDIECTVQPDQNLAASACAIGWEDGGAMRDPGKLLADIEKLLQDILAGRGAKGHDERQGEHRDDEGETA